MRKTGLKRLFAVPPHGKKQQEWKLPQHLVSAELKHTPRLLRLEQCGVDSTLLFCQLLSHLLSIYL